MTLSADFEACSVPIQPEQAEQAEKTRPFSIRLTASERHRLVSEAGSLPLGTFIRGRLLGGSPRPRASLPQVDRKCLAQALALLGQTHYANNLNQLARLANMGALPLTPEVIEELASTLKLIAEVRSLIVDALGQGGRR
jgi:hypothetical protein